MKHEKFTEDTYTQEHTSTITNQTPSTQNFALALNCCTSSWPFLFARHPINYFCAFLSTVLVGCFFGISDEMLLAPWPQRHGRSTRTGVSCPVSCRTIRLLDEQRGEEKGRVEMCH